VVLLWLTCYMQSSLMAHKDSKHPKVQNKSINVPLQRIINPASAERHRSLLSHLRVCQRIDWSDWSRNFHDGSSVFDNWGESQMRQDSRWSMSMVLSVNSIIFFSKQLLWDVYDIDSWDLFYGNAGY
jgi:hypothetical protein